MCDIKPFTPTSTPKGDFHSIHRITISLLWESKLITKIYLITESFIQLLLLHVAESCIKRFFYFIIQRCHQYGGYNLKQQNI